jgi:hypothetical protein
VAPVDADARGDLLSRFADALLTGHSLADLVDQRDLPGATIGEAEARSAQAAALRWFTRRHPGAGAISSAQADALEAAAAARVIELVPREIEGAEAGRCIDCSAETAPWFSRCDPCQAATAGRTAVRPAAAAHGPQRTATPPVRPSRAVRRRQARRSR